MYFDTRTSRALMESRLEEARKASRRRRSVSRNLDGVRKRLGTWMIARGEKLAGHEPKIA